MGATSDQPRRFIEQPHEHLIKLNGPSKDLMQLSRPRAIDAAKEEEKKGESDVAKHEM